MTIANKGIRVLALLIAALVLLVGCAGEPQEQIGATAVPVSGSQAVTAKPQLIEFYANW